jgi:GT2 family glycosyltransferase
MGISVVIPSYNPPPEHLAALYGSLLTQTCADFEVVVVDDGSEHADYGLFQDVRFRVLREPHRGPASCRNIGAAAARYGALFFTDTDCELDPGALQCAVVGLARDGAVAGNTITRVKTFLGKAIALLGFPGGGILGFDRVWRVDSEGHARSFSSCNVAFRKSLFEAMGGFNETFPVAGGEDTVLARKLVEAGHRIRYQPGQIVYHVDKRDLRGFLRWQLTRGRGNYYIKQHVPEVGGYLRLRVWTFKNSLVQAGPLYALPVLALITISVCCQIIGFQQEKMRQRRTSAQTPR